MLTFRILAAFLAIVLTLPNPAWASPELGRRTLRASQPETPDQKAGLEEELNKVDWTPYWDSGWVTSAGLPYSGELMEIWRRFFVNLSVQAPSARVLDIGTGNLAVPKIAKEVQADFELHGIDRADIKPQRISGSYGIQFRRADTEKTGYPDAHFDVVTGMYGLEYSDTELSIPELARVLRPGGDGMFILHHSSSVHSRKSRFFLENGLAAAAIALFERLRDYAINPSTGNEAILDSALDAFAEFPSPYAFPRDIYQRVTAHRKSLLEDREGTISRIESEIEGEQFFLDSARDLLRAAVSPEQVPEWTARLARAGLVVDRFEPMEDEMGLVGWRLELHKPLPAGLEEPETVERRARDLTLRRARMAAEQVRVLLAEPEVRVTLDHVKYLQLRWAMEREDRAWFHGHLNRPGDNGLLFLVEPVAGASGPEYRVTDALMEVRDLTGFYYGTQGLLAEADREKLLGAGEACLRENPGLLKGLKRARERVLGRLPVVSLYDLEIPEMPFRVSFQRDPYKGHPPPYSAVTAKGISPAHAPGLASTYAWVFRRVSEKPTEELLASAGLPVGAVWAPLDGALQQLRAGDILRHPTQEAAGYYRVENIGQSFPWTTARTVTLRDLTDPDGKLKILWLSSMDTEAPYRAWARPPAAAGLEEVEAGQALDLLAEAATKDGVVVIGLDALESHAGLEELVKRAPQALAPRMVLFGVGAAALARVRAANPAVRVVESGEVADLVAFLLALPEAERVSVLGAALLAEQLRQILPVTVNLLPREAALRFILAAAGVSGLALDQVDLARLQQFLAQRQSA